MIGLVRLLALAATLFWAASASAQAPLPMRMALILGNSMYDQTPVDSLMRLKPLPNACNDAQKVAAKLVKLGWKEDEEVKLACNLKTAEMKGLIDAFVQKLQNNPGSVAFFYFAGHGAQVDQSAFIFGTDAAINITTEKYTIDQALDRRLFVNSAVNTFDDFLAQVGDNLESGFTALIDACRSDPLILALNGNGPRRVTAPRNAPFKYPGQLVGVSTQNGDVALDGVGANGPYALALYDNLDSQETLAKTMLKVTMQVKKVTRSLNPTRPQIPTYDGSSMIECLGRCRGDPPPIVLAPARHSSVRHPWLRQALWQSASAAPPIAVRQIERPMFEQVFRKLESPSLVASTVSETPGLRLNIFWCDGVPEAAHNQALAERLRTWFKDEAVKSEDFQFVNIRVLSAQANAGPEYRYLANTISYDPENLRAALWAARASTVVQLAPVAGKIRDDVRIYVCETASRDGNPARVFWQVPNAKWLIYAEGLQHMMAEAAGQFQSVRGIEVVKNAPDATEVRFYHDQDRAPAFRLADSIQALTGGIVTVQKLTSLATNVQPGTIEAWLGRGLTDSERQRIESMRVSKDIFDTLNAVKTTAPSRNRVINPES